ncbi:RNA polymerase sigma-70 factor, ECF subfamily [bacterium A37T11]|nr:RNA polymerase sigma-70 factor, ECF subfamily [bacterium A37T11]
MAISTAMIDYKKYTDPELSTLLNKGDKFAFSVVYERYFELLFRHALRILKDKEDAQDVVQDVYTKLWENHHLINIQNSLQGYLYTSTQNAVLRKLQRSKQGEKYIEQIQKTVFQEHGSIELKFYESELKKIIEQEIGKLPPKMRRVFELSRLHYHTTSEIAGKLGIAENTVKRQISNAIHILRKKLTEWNVF